ncbi:hypothetical protein ACFFX0_20350 [Citricoccus parietis]|uniref:Uncharacterized protein n=1 Tax=Citricoccus parietis TaxID=592307 RepID=A0ABV5G3B2_9MICC
MSRHRGRCHRRPRTLVGRAGRWRWPGHQRGTALRRRNLPPGSSGT